MGNSYDNCSRKDEYCGIIDREMKIYEWRNRNMEKFVAGVEVDREGRLGEEMFYQKYLDSVRDQTFIDMAQVRTKLKEIGDRSSDIVSF